MWLDSLERGSAAVRSRRALCIRLRCLGSLINDKEPLKAPKQGKDVVRFNNNEKTRLGMR